MTVIKYSYRVSIHISTTRHSYICYPQGKGYPAHFLLPKKGKGNHFFFPFLLFKDTGQTVDQFTELHTPERNGFWRNPGSSFSPIKAAVYIQTRFVAH